MSIFSPEHLLLEGVTPSFAECLKQLVLAHVADLARLKPETHCAHIESRIIEPCRALPTHPVCGSVLLSLGEPLPTSEAVSMLVQHNGDGIVMEPLDMPADKLQETSAACDEENLRDKSDGNDPAYRSGGSSKGSSGRRHHSFFSDAENDCQPESEEVPAMLDDVDKHVLCRLQNRLGILTWADNVSATSLHDTLCSLGLLRYTLEDMGELLIQMSIMSTPPKEEGRNSFSNAIADVSKTFRGTGPARFILHRFSVELYGVEQSMPFQNFAEVLLSTPETLQRELGAQMSQMVLTIEDVLVSGETNKLIAELTNVRVDDLAAPMPKLLLDDILEPISGLVILINGVVIGIQSDEGMVLWEGWRWVELLFTLFFTGEMCLRIYFSGLWHHFLGDDSSWNVFDAIIVIIAIVDTLIDFLMLDLNVSALTLLRTIRLTRLSRLIRIFRFKKMQELNHMVKGLLAGFRTLFFAMVLLFFMIYVVAVLMTVAFGTDNKVPLIQADSLFSSVPRSMFTAFRCFTGDCETSEGTPIVYLLADAYGPPFIFGHIISTMIVTFGLFNLIMAIYVENTMTAAKRADENNKMRRDRESLRIAKTTKALVEQFCVGHQLSEHHGTLNNEFHKEFKAVTRRSKVSLTGSRSLRHTHADLSLHEDVIITRELFLLFLQNPDIQNSLDDLDIQPDRAHLFDILDADQSGAIHVHELVIGLLKVRGQARKSDQVACLLAVQAVHEMLRNISDGQARILKMNVSSRAGVSGRIDSLDESFSEESDGEDCQERSLSKRSLSKQSNR